MSTSGLKAIAPVPTASDFLDIVLSKTQRKTPTVIHKNFKISRIRNFYMRKVKFTQDSFDEKLGSILSDFPVLDDLHPFLSSLMNVLYDKNHYKLALGQLRTARHLIDQVAKDYVRLLKFGDSLYRCKQLKRAALGRMATIMRRQKDPLAYLEQVRQHISRLPAIDPNTRTLIICGYPNVGKSSFINKVTRVDVDVQPYAFTTKSLFVGHLDYKYLRWQVIDTPGILDHPLEEMNTIEMQSITALAHLKSCVLYFMDLSEQCGYTIEAQCQLFHSIKPLFTSKPTLLVLNKSDITTLSSLPDSTQSLITSITSNPTGDHPVTLVECSCYTEEGVMDLRNKACDLLLAARVEGKIKKIGGGGVSTTTSSSSVLNRLHVSVPQKRDDVVREAFIPDKVKEKREKGEKMYDKEDPGRKRLLRDREVEEGGAGVFNINMKESYLLANPEWKEDIMPEIMDGKNIADFIDPDIVEKLEALEREEEKLVQEGFYDSDPEDPDFDSLDEEEERVTEKSRSARLNSQATKKSLKNHAKMPRTAGLRTLSELSKGLTRAGYDPSRIRERAEGLAKVVGEKRKRAEREEREREREGDVEMEMEDAEGGWEDDDDGDSDVEMGDGDEAPRLKRTKGNSGGVVAVGGGKRVPRTNRAMDGLRDGEQAIKATKLRNFGQRPRNMLARAGEGDRAIKTKMPKHLFAGKRKAGKTSRR